MSRGTVFFALAMSAVALGGCKDPNDDGPGLIVEGQVTFAGVAQGAAPVNGTARYCEEGRVIGNQTVSADAQGHYTMDFSPLPGTCVDLDLHSDFGPMPMGVKIIGVRYNTPGQVQTANLDERNISITSITITRP